tara:strand:- start:1952 stop:2152 length:201 start_codon:yes stop_codon:yes gene_type:complete
MSYILKGKRKQKHLDYIYKFLVKIDTECRSLRLNMNDENQDESVKEMRRLTDLQKKYKRRYQLLNF